MLPRSAYTVQLPIFEGPLDLLLQLIEREELDITKVSLAQVTDQFLGYLKILESLNIADLAEFLVVAARLILIKSEALLPRPAERQPGEEDPADELARQLIAYKRYKEIAGTLHEREAAGLHTYLRLAPPPKVEAKLDPRGLTPLALLEAVRRALALTPDLPSLGDEYWEPYWAACAQRGIAIVHVRGNLHSMRAHDRAQGLGRLCGLEDVVVVRARGITLVTTAERAPDLKKLLDRLPGMLAGERGA